MANTNTIKTYCTLTGMTTADLTACKQVADAVVGELWDASPEARPDLIDGGNGVFLDCNDENQTEMFADFEQKDVDTAVDMAACVLPSQVRKKEYNGLTTDAVYCLQILPEVYFNSDTRNDQIIKKTDTNIYYQTELFPTAQQSIFASL